jgi:Na+/H+-dicarboxylate symporter
VLHRGHSFNLDGGSCIVMTVPAMFIAQAADVGLWLGQQLTPNDCAAALKLGLEGGAARQDT